MNAIQRVELAVRRTAYHIDPEQHATLHAVRKVLQLLADEIKNVVHEADFADNTQDAELEMLRKATG